MDLSKAMKERHSVRAVKDEPIAEEAISALNEAIKECNEEGGLHFQLVLNEPQAFGGLMARYGSFSGVKNYVAFIGKKGKDIDEKIGYYGAKVMLVAQAAGLNSCWVALTYKKVKTAYEIAEGEKLYSVLALGYGVTQGVPHKNKPEKTLINRGVATARKATANVKETTATAAEVGGTDTATADAGVPEWFDRGARAAMLAPTATNQQRFYISYEGGNMAKAVAKSGFYSRMDLGIVKYFFELGAGKENFVWTE